MARKHLADVSGTQYTTGMGKHFASSFLGGLGVISAAVAIWLAYFAIKGLPTASPAEQLPMFGDFMLMHMKTSTLTLSACVFIASAVFLVGAFVVHQLEDRRP